MDIQREIEQLAAGFNGRLALSLLNLQTNETMSYHDNEQFPTASAIKLGIVAALMALVDAGKASLDEPIMLRRADHVAGSGVLQHLSPGLIMPLRDWAFLMMNISDNLATNVLIDYVGLDNVQRWLDGAGFADVQLHRHISFGTPPPDKPHIGTATAAGLTRLLTAVFRRQLVSPALCDEMMRLMNGVGADRVGRFLPFAYYGSDEAEETRLRLAGKTGTIKGVRVQTAVVWRGPWQNNNGFVITAMTQDDPAPELWSTDAAGNLLIGQLARLMYDAIFPNTEVL